MIVITGGAGFIGSSLAKIFHPEEIIIIDSWLPKLRLSSNNIGVNANKIKEGSPLAIGYP